MQRCISYRKMAKKVVSVVISRGKKKPAKRINKRRKLKSALKMIFNYMKSDSYMFAPLIHPQSSLPGKVSFTGMEKEEKKLIGDGYLKCDAYMYAPLVRDSGTTNPSSESARDDDGLDPVRRILVEQSLLQSERVKHILEQKCRSLSSTGSQRKTVADSEAERAHTQLT